MEYGKDFFIDISDVDEDMDIIHDNEYIIMDIDEGGDDE